MTSRAAPRDHLLSVLGPVVEAAGYDLEDLVVTPAGRRSLVRVVVDADHGITLDDIAELSQRVSAALDDGDDGLGATPYVLEVSSPGVGRPLTLPRHWRRAADRLVLAERRGDDPPVTGRVVDSDEEGVTLDVDGTPRRLAFADIRKARVQVEFGRRSEEDET